MRKSDSARGLLNTLRVKGVRLWRDADRIRYNAPDGVLTPELLASIRKLKSKLLPHLEPDHPLILRSDTTSGNLVLLHASARSRTVFCIHAIDGWVGSYLQLSRELSSEAATYGLHAIDLVMKTRLPTSIQGIARYYVDQIQKVQTTGPYSLVGWSSGGWVAFEMACELDHRGHEVSGVTVLDTVPPRAPDLDPPPSGQGLVLSGSQERSALLWWRFVLSQKSIPELDDPMVPGLFWTMDDEEKSRYLLENCRDEQVFFRNSALRGAETTRDILFLYDMVNVQFDAIANYEPSTGTAPINVFVACPEDWRADVQKGRQLQLESYWKSRTTGRIRSERVVGGHSAPLNKPAVSDVARCILAPTRT